MPKVSPRLMATLLAASLAFSAAVPASDLPAAYPVGASIYQRARDIPAEMFGSAPALAGVVMSPDGQRFAAYHAQDSGFVLLVNRIDEPIGDLTVRIPVKDARLQWLAWATP